MRSLHARITAGLFVTVLSPVATYAQPAPSSATPVESGDLRVLVFVDATPVEGVTIAVGDAAPERTGRDGAASLSLPEGEYAIGLSVPWHVLPGAQPGRRPVRVSTASVRVVAYEEVEVIITLTASGQIAKLDVEEATGDSTDRQRVKDFDKRRRTRPQGIVRGKIYTEEARQPVAGADVFVRGAPIEAKSDDQGAFELELPEGEYDLVIIHRRYVTIKLERVEVDANRPKELRVAAKPVTTQLADFVVTAPHIEGGVASLVEERRESVSVDEVIGAEEMSQSGDSDAAGALRRVTGITVIGGQFVYVRGMGERYSSTLLNGQAVPSPEPERRVIPLDLFSTDVLQSVVIQKTPSPDAPGEFGGGVVRLRTRAFPSAFTLSASLSTGMLSTATFQSRPRYDGGRLDLLGIDDGGREIPQAIRKNAPLREGNLFQEGFTVEELAEMGRLLSNNYQVSNETISPNVGLGITIGDALDVGGKPSGYLLSLGWSNDYSYSEESRRRYVVSDLAEDGLELNNDFVVRELGQTVGVNGIFVTGIEPADGHDLRATSMLLRISDSAAGVLTGRSDDLGQDLEQFRLGYVERMLLTQQLSGEHELPALGGGTLAWRAAFSRASRSEPDRREYFYADESIDPDMPPTDFQISARPAGNLRVWNELTDKVWDLGLDYTQSFRVWNELSANIKVGGTAVFRDRDYSNVRLTLRAPRMLTAAQRRLPAEEIWAPANLNADSGWILEDNTQPTDAYTADQVIQAGYAMARLPITKTIEMTAGARIERSRQRVITFSPFATDAEPLKAELDNTDILPSVTGKWRAADDIVVRAGYGRSLTRPDFRELSESSYRDVITATRFVGNAALERGIIDHLDTRFEYYFSTDESLSVAAFYKSLRRPIEQIDLGGVDRTVSWDNAESARNIGVELEARRRFGFLSESLDELFVAVNLAYIRSTIVLGEEQAGVSTSQERALQGQSDYVVNVRLGYDDALDSGHTAIVLYNVFGPRIRDVGRLRAPDVFEAPFHQLDLVYGYQFGDAWKLKVKLKNLLDRAVEFRQGPKVTRRYRSGRSLGISLGWSH